MPDVFTPLMIIALVLLCFARDLLPTSSVIMLILLIAGAVAFHQSNLPVAAWMLPAFALSALLGWRPSKPFLQGFFASGSGLMIGMLALVTVNMITGSFGVSNSGSVFLLARMLGDGTALTYLEQICPQQRFAVCGYLDELKSHSSNPLPPALSRSDYFLWGGPLQKLGGFRAEEAEASAIVRGTLSSYPVAQLRAAVANGWRQFLLFPTGDGMGPYSEEDAPSKAIRYGFDPSVYDNYRHSRQIRNELGLDWINRIHLAVIITSLFLLAGSVFLARINKQLRLFYASIFVVILMTGNAFTLGALSEPGGRYQSRVIWLVPLLASCFMLKSARGYARLLSSGADA